MATKPAPAPKFKAMKHQADSIKFGVKAPRLFDMSDPGTGKTYVQIMLYAKRRKKGEKMLVIAPKSLLEPAWEADIGKFAPELRVSVARADNREAAFAADADVYVTNTDAVVWLGKKPKPFFKDFKHITVDELTTFKHHTSQRSRALNKIKVHFPHRSGLTGTPNPNTITDIWNQVNFLDDGKRLGPSFFAFRSAVCIPKQVGSRKEMVQWEDKPGAEEAVFALLADITVRHRFEDCIDIPENLEYTVPYKLGMKQMRAYKEMAMTQIAALGKGKAITAINAAAVTTKLLQIACIAYNTPVLTINGWKPIQEVGRAEAVWDGVEWVQHSGSVLKGTEEVIECYGVFMTPEHKVLTLSGWQTASECIRGKSSGRFTRETVRVPNGGSTMRYIAAKASNLAMPLHVRDRGDARKPEPAVVAPTKCQTLRMPAWRAYKNARHVALAAVRYLDQNAQPVQFAARQGLLQLRRAWNQSMPRLGQFIQHILAGHANGVRPQINPGTYEQRQGVQPPQLSLGNCQRTVEQYTPQPRNRDAQGQHDSDASCGNFRDKESDAICAAQSRVGHTPRFEPVYDLVNCGPRSRFVVQGSDGQPLIVHNSGAVYEHTGKYHLIDPGRYELTLDLVEERKHSLVFYLWQHQRDYLVEHAKKRGIKFCLYDSSAAQSVRTQMIKDYQNGFYQVMFAHPQSAAHGLTLTRGTATIWPSVTYNLEHFVQGNKRVFRNGQKSKTETIIIVAPDTLEEKVYEKLQGKNIRMMNLLDLFT